MFEWTWPRTLIGLGIAILLGALALAFSAGLRTQREEIMKYGQQVTVRVVDVKPGFGRTHDSVVEYNAFGGPHRVEISDGLGDALPEGSSAILLVDPESPERLANRDGYSSLAGRTAPYHLSIFAGLAAAVSALGRIGTMSRNRSGVRPVRRPRIWWGRRGVMRRADWFWRTLLGFGLAGLTLIPLGARPSLLIAGVCAPIIAGGYLMGVARKVVVTPAELIVFDAFTITWIPRHLISGFRADPDGPVEIRLKGHKPAGFGVEGSAQRTIAKLKALTEDLPEEPNAGEPSAKRRWVAIIALGASAALFAFVLLQAVQQQ